MGSRASARIGAASVVVAVLVLSGCGSSSGSTSSGAAGTSTTSGSKPGAGTSVDVCKIVTPADAQKVVGGTAVAQAPAGGEGSPSGVCIYQATGGGARVSLLQVRVYPGPQFYGEAALPNTKSIHLAGTDKAFVRVSAGGGSIDVQFVKDGKTGAINFADTTATSDAAVHDVEAVAQKLADGI